MSEFTNLLNDLIGGQTAKKEPTLEEQLAMLEKKEREAKAAVDKMRAEIEAKQKAEKEEAAKEREIVVRYVPHKPGTARVISGGKFIEPDKPDNVAGLLDAAALLMAEAEGVNRYALQGAMLTALMEALDLELLVKELKA